MKVYGYLRVSCKQQVKFGGLDRQRESINLFVSESGNELVEVFEEEGVSGTTWVDDRPAFIKMVEQMSREGVEHVIVERLDRLARQYMVQEQIVVYLAVKGISIWVSSTGENITEAITSDPMKKALVQMQGVFAELEKSLLLARMNAGKEKKLRETGKCGGRLSWAEKYPDRQEALVAIVRRMRRRPKGCNKVSSYTAIARFLNEKEFKSYSGKPWTESMTRSFHLRYC